MSKFHEYKSIRAKKSDGYYTGEYTASSSVKWAQADQARSRTIAKMIKEGYVADKPYEVKSFSSWTSNDVNDFNDDALKSAIAYQKRAMNEMHERFGKDFKFKVVKFETYE